MPTAFKSAKAILYPALRDALAAWLAGKETNADSYYTDLYADAAVVRDASSGKPPPAIRLKSPTEQTDETSKQDIYSELTVTMRITASSEHKADVLSGGVSERLSRKLDFSHRLDLSEYGFDVTRQTKDMPDNPLHEPSDSGIHYGIMQRYRFIAKPH